jgi:pimeloyl-ACP methyl ester carboxylesterase
MGPQALLSGPKRHRSLTCGQAHSGNDMLNRTFTINWENADFTIASRLRDTGGDLIFFIHGLGCAKEHFDEAWGAGELEKFALLAIDLPGFGDSSKPENFSYGLSDHAKICGKILALFPGRGLHIVGHSMGGAIGVLAAESVRTRLKSFVNVEGNLIGHDSTVSRSSALLTLHEFRTRELPRMLLSTSMSPEPGMRLWSRCIRKADPRGFYLSSLSLTEWSDRGVLLKKFAGLECRKIYVYGERDRFLKVLARLDGIPTAEISGSGHFPMNDNPGEFYSLLADFVKKE